MSDYCKMTAFGSFFNEHREKFVAFAYSYVRDEHEAEDIVMKSVEALWNIRDKWDENSNLKALLLTIVKNKALNYLDHIKVRMRYHQKVQNHSQRELDLRISTLSACDPNDIFNAELQNMLSAALLKLPKQSRDIFMLSRFSHNSNKEIAQKLGISVKSVEFHITKTLKLLRKELKDYVGVLLLF